MLTSLTVGVAHMLHHIYTPALLFSTTPEVLATELRQEEEIQSVKNRDRARAGVVGKTDEGSQKVQTE